MEPGDEKESNLDPVIRMEQERRQAIANASRPLVIDLAPALQLEYWRGVALGFVIGLSIAAVLALRVRE